MKELEDDWKIHAWYEIRERKGVSGGGKEGGEMIFAENGLLQVRRGLRRSAASFFEF